MSKGAALAALAALACACGCDRAPAKVSPIKDDAAPASSAKAVTACVPSVAEKIGVPFVRVCPRAAVDSSEPAPSFWISAIPLGCSAGEHGTLACPPVTSLVQPPRELPDFRAPSPKLAAVVDAYTAHKVCTMRFAGRLPTRVERAHARAALGLASVVVSEPGGGRPLRVREIAEWVTAVPCDQPSDLGKECKEDRYPTDAISAVSFRMLARCAARPVKDPTFPMIDLGGECAGAREGGGLLGLPCTIRGLAYTSSGPTPSAFGGFELACEPPSESAEHPDNPRADIAAFRCLLPEWV